MVDVLVYVVVLNLFVEYLLAGPRVTANVVLVPITRVQQDLRRSPNGYR